MTSVTSRAQRYSQGKLRLKRWVFRRLRKTGSDCADVTWCGRQRESSAAVRRQPRTAHQPEMVTRPNADDVEPRRLPSDSNRDSVVRFRWCQEVERNAALLRFNWLRADLLLQASSYCSLRSPFTPPMFSRTCFQGFSGLQCVSKNIPDIFSCNFRKHCRIFIMFGTHVTEKVSNQ